MDAQINLFRLLIQSERPAGWKVVMSRWERMCEFVSAMISVASFQCNRQLLQNPESPLLHSDEAFELYLSALVKADLSTSVNPAVQRREQLVRAHSLPAPPSSEQSAGQNSSASVADSVPLSRSQEIAQKVLANVSAGPAFNIPPGPLIGSAKQTLAPISMSALAGAGAGGGGPSNPIYVTIAERAFSLWLLEAPR